MFRILQVDVTYGVYCTMEALAKKKQVSGQAKLLVIFWPRRINAPRIGIWSSQCRNKSWQGYQPISDTSISVQILHC